MLAVAQVSGLTLNGAASLHPAQFSIKDWSRRMSACWLAISCWSFFTKAIRSLMLRNKFSAKFKISFLTSNTSDCKPYHRSRHGWSGCPHVQGSCWFASLHWLWSIGSNHVCDSSPNLQQKGWNNVSKVWLAALAAAFRDFCVRNQKQEISRRAVENV